MVRTFSTAADTSPTPAMVARQGGEWGDAYGPAQWQAQPPPWPRGAAKAAATSAPETLEVARPPVDAKTDSSFTVSACPLGQNAGASDSLIGRFSSNTASHVLQRNS